MATMVRGELMEIAHKFTLALECADAVLVLGVMEPTELNIDREKNIIRLVMEELEGRSGVPAC